MADRNRESAVTLLLLRMPGRPTNKPFVSTRCYYDQQNTQPSGGMDSHCFRKPVLLFFGAVCFNLGRRREKGRDRGREVNDSKEKRKEYNKFYHDILAHGPLFKGHYRNIPTTPASTSLEYSPGRLVGYAISFHYMQSILETSSQRYPIRRCRSSTFSLPSLIAFNPWSSGSSALVFDLYSLRTEFGSIRFQVSVYRHLKIGNLLSSIWRINISTCHIRHGQLSESELPARLSVRYLLPEVDFTSSQKVHESNCLPSEIEIGLPTSIGECGKRVNLDVPL